MTSPKILLGVFNLETRDTIQYRLHHEYMIGQWQMFNDGDPFTENDLRNVIRHLRALVKSGKRNPGCLRFSTLIGDPERFAEERSLYRQFAGSPRGNPPSERQRVLSMTGREDKPATTLVKSAGDVLESSKKWHEQADKLAQWKRENLT